MPAVGLVVVPDIILGLPTAQFFVSSICWGASVWQYSDDVDFNGGHVSHFLFVARGSSFFVVPGARSS